MHDSLHNVGPRAKAALAREPVVALARDVPVGLDGEHKVTQAEHAGVDGAVARRDAEVRVVLGEAVRDHVAHGLLLQLALTVDVVVPHARRVARRGHVGDEDGARRVGPCKVGQRGGGDARQLVRAVEEEARVGLFGAPVEGGVGRAAQRAADVGVHGVDVPARERHGGVRVGGAAVEH